jgi:ABC-type sugar transport system ATPase subunit
MTRVPPAPLLRFEGVSKRFGGAQAVDDVTLDVHAGEVLALLGDDGAGKSAPIEQSIHVSHRLDHPRVTRHAHV